MILFSGRANRELSEKIANHLGIPLGQILIKNFSDGEIFVQLKESVRGRDVFIIQPTSYPANENLMELLIITDAVKRASAKRITLVLPYYGYARQDRKDRPHVPITSKLVANLIVSAGADRILTMDLHADQIQGFFDIPVDHLFAAPVFINYLKENFSSFRDFVVVSPDAGGMPRARFMATHLGCDIAMIDKRRTGDNQSEALHIVGNVKDKKAIIVDDIVDTAGTLVNAVNAIKEHGACEVYACATHPVLSGPAYERIENCELKKLLVTDTIPLKQKHPKIEVLTVSHFFAQAIYHIHIEKSLSAGGLFLE